MADSSYESEVHGIEAFLDMQRNKDKISGGPGGVGLRVIEIIFFVILCAT